MLSGAAYLGLSLARCESFSFFRRNHALNQYASANLRTCVRCGHLCGRRIAVYLLDVLCLHRYRDWLFDRVFPSESETDFSNGAGLYFRRCRRGNCQDRCKLHLLALERVNTTLNYKSAAEADVYGLNPANAINVTTGSGTA